MKYIDAEKLVGKIENIGLFPTKSADYNDGREDMKMMILDIVDSFQQEQPEVELEKEIVSICKTYGITEHLDAEFGQLDIKNIARHFYELGLKAGKEEQTMITEDYVSFEIAKLLNTKGFKGEFHKYYWGYELGKEFLTSGSFNPEYDYPAPTLQTVMKWLREAHKIIISISFQYDKFNQPWYFYKIANIGKKEDWSIEKSEHITVEEATEAAIKYTLENLI